MLFRSPVSTGVWGWIRAALSAVSTASNTLTVTPLQTIQFTEQPHVSLEEGATLYWDATTRSLRESFTTDLSNPVSPVWGPSNEVAANVSSVSFSYFNPAGSPVTPSTLSERSAVRRIEVNVVVETTAPLHHGRKVQAAGRVVVTPENIH